MKIRLDIFEGPLDLLLYLIKKNHLNIYDIPIADVVEQYLQFLELMKLLDINVVSEYLVMAANLIKIKSQMLLPISKEEEDESCDDPRDILVQKLLEYEKFRQAAQFLKEKESQRLKVFTRPAAQPQEGMYREASIFDLINALKTTLKDIPRDIFFEVIKDEFTVEEKIHYLLHLLLAREKLSLEELFLSAKNKLEIVVIFLAILELIKLKEIIILQEILFGPILIRRRENIYSPL